MQRFGYIFIFQHQCAVYLAICMYIAKLRSCKLQIKHTNIYAVAMKSCMHTVMETHHSSITHRTHAHTMYFMFLANKFHKSTVLKFADYNNLLDLRFCDVRINHSNLRIDLRTLTTMRNEPKNLWIFDLLSLKKFICPPLVF